MRSYIGAAHPAKERFPPGILWHSVGRTCALALDIHACQGDGPGGTAAGMTPGARPAAGRGMGGPPGGAGKDGARGVAVAGLAGWDRLFARYARDQVN